MIAPARVAAFDVLRAVGARRVDLPAALAHVRNGLPDERDRALAGEIAAGTLRWQGAFDHLIAVYAKRPLDRLDPEVADILRLSIFQLLHLDRVPASAAVNDAVNLARRAGKASAAPLVNAVLRRVGRERERLPLPARMPGTREAEIAYLSTTLSHPGWLVARWLDRHGFEAAEAWCRFDNEAAPLTLRANTLRIGRQALAERLLAAGVKTTATRFAPEGLVVVSGNPLLTPLAREGLFAVQDEASQLVAVVAAPRPGDRVFDACAAPGGKATAMSALVGDRGLVVAADVRPKRVQLLAETVRAAGGARIAVVRADAARPLPFPPVFDCVLIDAPCSGLGTLRRDPDIKWRRHDGEFEALADLQGRMLRHAAVAVRPGGRLVYATCSSEPEENELVVARFLEDTPGFVPARVELPGAPELVNAAGHFRTWPFRDGLEAFFAATLVKAPDLG